MSPPDSTAASPAVSPILADKHTFSSELGQLVARLAGQPASLDDIFEATRGRGYYVVLVLIAAPFVSPLPLPGVSIPFGFAITALGIRLGIDRGPWLPRRLLQRKLAPRFLASVMGAATRLMTMLEIVVRPRWGFVSNHAIFSRIAGLLIAAAGVMLMLPIPLPFSNSLPAWAVLLLSIGALGRDGLFFFLGCGAFLLAVAYFGFIAISGARAVELLERSFGF